MPPFLVHEVTDGISTLLLISGHGPQDGLPGLGSTRSAAGVSEAESCPSSRSGSHGDSGESGVKCRD
ncbi:MAG: hypothetical protein WCK70_07590 [Chloroflexales bacterium]